MTDREKLIALMIEAKKADTEDVPFSEFLADFLVANGVTFATDTNDGDKWISVEKRLPSVNTDALVVYQGGAEGRYVGADSLTKDGEWLWAGEDEKVTHWMPLPEPPKEE